MAGAGGAPGAAGAAEAPAAGPDAGGRARRTLYVGGLDEAVTAAVLQAAFIPFGELLDVQLPLDVTTQKAKGFGFVEYADEGDAADAVDNLNDAELFGRVLRVTLARPPKAKAQAVWASADEWYRALKESGDADEDLAAAVGGGAGAGGGGGAGAGAAASSSSSSSGGGGGGGGKLG